MKKFIAVIQLLFLCQQALYAQPARVVTLDTLLHRIDTFYPAILQYRQSAQSWLVKAEGAKSWMAPTLSSGLMSFPYDMEMIKEKDDPMNEAGISFSVEQMFPNNRKLNARRDYMKAMAEAELSKSEWTGNQLRRDAKILYYNRFINQQKRNVLTESEAVLDLVLATAESRFSSNRTQLQNIYKAKARLTELKNMQYMLSGLIAESNIGINTLMMQETNTPFEIDTTIRPSYYSSAGVTNRPKSERSDIAALSGFINSMKREQQVMKAGLRPEFGVRAEHMQMLGMPNQWSVMGMITLPMVPWSSKMYSSEVKAMDLQIKSMEQEKQTMQLMASRMSAERLSMLNFEYGQYDNYRKEIVPAYAKNLEAGLLAYRENTGDLFVLLDAWEMLLMKKLEMYDRLLNILNLEAEYEYEMEIK